MKKITVYTIILIIIDQISKILVSKLIPLNNKITIIKDFLDFNYVQNKGAAFSILEGKQFFLILIAIIMVILIYYYLKQKKQIKNIEIIIYSLILGGIIGNLIDRLIYKYVIDFISFKIFNIKFAIFNFADSFIVIGCIIYILYTLKEEKNGNNN